MICLVDNQTTSLSLNCTHTIHVALPHTDVETAVWSLGYGRSSALQLLPYFSNTALILHHLSCTSCPCSSVQPVLHFVGVWGRAHMWLSVCLRTSGCSVRGCACAWRTGVESPAEAAGISCKFFWFLNWRVNSEPLWFWLQLHDYNTSDNSCFFVLNLIIIIKHKYTLLNRKALFYCKVAFFSNFEM